MALHRLIDELPEPDETLRHAHPGRYARAAVYLAYVRDNMINGSFETISPDDQRALLHEYVELLSSKDFRRGRLVSDYVIWKQLKRLPS